MVDDEKLCILIGAFGQIYRTCVNQNGARNPATAQVFGLNKRELVFVQRQESVYVTIEMIG